MLGQTLPGTNKVTVAWDPNPVSDAVTGYRVLYGTVSRVYSYTNTTATGSVTSSVISGLAGGVTYFFAVTAFNAYGLESDFSDELNYTPPSTLPVPTITLTSPASGTSYAAPAAITLAAGVSANGHTITKVQFYNGAVLLGEDPAAPFTFTWSSVSAGSYSVTARAVYDTGSSITSSAVTVTVINPAPTIVLTAPLNGASYAAPATINFAATVTANGHTITMVQFYNAATLLGEDTASPYSFTWSNVSAGNYSLTARLIYDASSIITSSPASIGVSGLPAPWQTADIGSVAVSGSATFFNGTYTVNGAGNISSTADNFRFTHQLLSGDGEITVRLNSVEDTGTKGRMGVMMRESLTSGSTYAFMGISPDGTFRWQRRRVTSGGTTTGVSVIGTPPNVWVRLVRTGNTLYGYRSADGTNWSLGGSRSIAMATTIYVGLAVASGSSNTLNKATFSSVTVVP